MMKKFNSNIRNILTLVLAVVMMLSISVPVSAATNTSPYGFTYSNSANGRTVYDYYVYDTSVNSYKLKEELYSVGSSVVTPEGNVIANNSKGAGATYNGFDVNGNFYIITTSGSLLKVTYNTTSVVLESGAKNLNYNSDDLAISVTTTTNTLSLKDLKPTSAPVIDEPVGPVVNKEKNRVEMYTNSANEMVYTAYKDGKTKTTIVVGGSKVLNSTAKVRLSDVLVGAKFLGFDSAYNVYLYESNGTLYRFKDGSWYSASKISLAGTYKTFKSDSKGFIDKIVTSKDTYSIKQLTTSGKWKANKTYVVSKADYRTLYIKGSEKSNTLSLKSKILYLNGKQIASGVSKYGFISKSKLVYLKGATVYTATLKNPGSAKKFCTKAKDFKANSLGLFTKVSLKSGKTKKLA